MSVHLLVLIHGMRGNPEHLSELKRIITDTYASSSHGIQLEVLVAEKNKYFATLDGIDWCGERVAQEIMDKVAELENDGKIVSKFSVTGYSLGGLIGRYAIGILQQRGFFKNVEPVNFNTMATPHIGLPRYHSFFSTLTTSLGPKLLSRSGEQLYLTDKWSATRRALLEVMADPAALERIFYQALQLFQQIRIYANAEFEEEYSVLIKSYEVPAIPPAPTPKPIILSAEWFRTRKLFSLPPRLQQLFPLNIVIYTLLPVLIPAFISFIVIRLSLETRSSRARIRLLEDDKTNTHKLVDILAELEDGIVEGATVDLVDDDASELGKRESLLSSTVATPNTKEKTWQQKSKQPILTPLQVKIAQWLNQLPLQKKLAFFPDVRNAHAVTISRDVKRFEFHRRGEPVIRHWAIRQLDFVDDGDGDKSYPQPAPPNDKKFIAVQPSNEFSSRKALVPLRRPAPGTTSN
ncbi:hypothetical protein H0H92_006162 [Tricholoma furcatifolium]|nr:hypothetical protein H0H92_006162 [Tricholoma furcatifolium]